MYILPELCIPPMPQGMHRKQFLKSWQSESIYGNEVIIDYFSCVLPAVEPTLVHYFQKVASLFPSSYCIARRTLPSFIQSCVSFHITMLFPALVI